MRRPAAALLAVALCAGLLPACTAPEPPSRAAVAIALPTAEGRWSGVADVLRDRIEAHGYTVDLRTAGDDIPTQVRQVGELLDARPLVLVVAAVDPGSLTPVLDRSDATTEVIALGAAVPDTAVAQNLVGFDRAAEGALQARGLLQDLGLVDEQGAGLADAPAGPFRIELFAGSPEDAGAELSFTAAMSVLDPYLASGRLTVPSGETTRDQVTTLRENADAAESRLTRILRDNYAGGAPDAVLAPSDRIARGVIAALLAQDADPFPPVTGGGAELRSLVAVLDGHQSLTLLEDPRSLAEEAAGRVLEVLAGGSLPIGLQAPVVVRAADIDELVIGSGYWSRERIDDAVAEFGLPTEPTATATPAP